MPVRKIAVVGHSHVGHLPLDSTVYPVDRRIRSTFRYARFSVPGTTACRLFLDRTLENPLRTYDPDVIVVYVGSNDIDVPMSHQWFFHRLMHSMIMLGNRLQGYTTNRKAEIIYMTIEQRRDPKNVTADCYKTRRNRMNSLLRNNKRMNLCMNFMTEDYFQEDGIHFQEEAYRVMAEKIKTKVENYAVRRRW